MPDYPISEEALEEAAEAVLEARMRGEIGARAAINAFLTAEGFGMERVTRGSGIGANFVSDGDMDMQRLVGPWRPSPR